MPKIVIGNGFSEAMVGDVSKNSIHVKQTAAVEARRLVWFVEDEDVIILPSPVSLSFINYVNKKLGRNLSEKNFIFASSDPKNPQILTSKVLLNKTMIAKLTSICCDKQNWYIFPYFHTSTIRVLADLLKKTLTLAPDFINQSGADLLNQKAIFRALFSKYVPIANGAVCRSAVELYYLVHQYLLKTDKLIVKQNMNASGDGNILLALNKEGVLAGIREVIFINHRDDFTMEMANKLWIELSDGCGNNQLVIEEYVTNKNTVYAEYEIHEQGTFEIISYGIVRMEGVADKRGKGMANWIGFEIPFKDRSNSTTEFLHYCEKLASCIAQLGFVGKINFDAIVCDDNRVLFTEINGRLGGCSHLPLLAKKFIGKLFLSEATLLTRNRVPIINFEQTTKIAEKLSKKVPDCGIVILNEDMACLKVIEYMVYAPIKTKALLLESEFLTQIN
jgi:hypothetical protein